MNVAAAQNRKRPRNGNPYPLWLRIFVPIFLVIFFVGGVYCGYLFYVTIREVVAHVELPAMPIFRFPSIRLPKALASQGSDEPLPSLPAMTPGAASSQQAGDSPQAIVVPGERINILLLGIDRRGEKNWSRLTDTIIIVSVDPANKTAVMLSIPRDLQVAIPGNGEDRINTVNGKGETQDYPGGGPALLKRTIEADFGIPIDYYIMIDFKGFVQIIDTLGGIDITVAKALTDTKYPDPLPEDPYHYKTIQFDAGPQHMDGARALEYARSRMSTTDFDRAKRQQELLKAIRNKALNLSLIPKIPSLLAALKDSVKTDMAVDEMLNLAGLAPQIDLGSLKQLVLEKPYVFGYKRPDGAQVQLPKWDLIQPALAELFATPAVVVQPTATPAPPTPTPTESPAEIEQLQELAREGARIAVQNGTSQPNYAAKVAAALMAQGYQVVEFGDADRVDYATTVIVDYTGKTYTLDRLVEMFHVAPENLRHSPNLRSRVDVRVIVGQDFVLPAQ